MLCYMVILTVQSDMSAFDTKSQRAFQKCPNHFSVSCKVTLEFLTINCGLRCCSLNINKFYKFYINNLLLHSHCLARLLSAAKGLQTNEPSNVQQLGGACKPTLPAAAAWLALHGTINFHRMKLLLLISHEPSRENIFNLSTHLILHYWIQEWM